VTVDEARRRLLRRLVVAGAVAGAVAAAGSGLAGLPGRTAFVVAALVTALGAVVAAVVGSALSIVDEMRGTPVSLARVVLILGLYAGSAVTVIALGALVGG
jgi:hypothetical protein